MVGTPELESDAWHEGYDAFFEGKLGADNPYSDGPVIFPAVLEKRPGQSNRENWWHGWCAGQRDEE